MKKEYVITIIVIVVLILISGFLMLYKKDCKTKECFDNTILKCQRSEFTSSKNNNIYTYKIDWSFGKECLLNIKLLKLAEGVDIETIKLLEGKEMSCKIPKNEINTIDKIPNLLDYCTGPLKEATYSLIIKRMYSLVLKQLTPIKEELERTIGVK